MSMWRKIVSWLCVLALLAVPGCCLGETNTLAIVQVYQEADTPTRLHVRLEGDVGGAPLTLAEGGIAEATIGTGTVPVVSMNAVTAEAFGGMRYVFVLDHAMPIGSNRIPQLKDGMYAWIDSLTERDQAAILISEPEEVRLAADFTSDKAVLRAAVDGYGKAVEYAGKNMIYSAIRQAIELAGRTDDALPRSSCVVVCSNGADTYQTLVTGEQLSQMLSADSIPLYVAGFAYTAQKEALVGLMNLARSSGGWSEDATPVNDQQTLDVALEKLRQRIMGGYDVVLDCSDGFVFNGATLISLRLREPDLLVKQTADLYLLKEDKAAAPKATATPDTTAAPQAGKDEEPMEEAVSWLEGETVLAGRAIGNLQLTLLGAGVVVLAILALLLLRRRKPAGANTPAASSELTTIQDKVAPVAPVSPGIPTGMAAGMAPGADAGKTVAVRGAGAMQPIQEPAPASQPLTRDAGKTLRVREPERQITSFVPGAAPAIDVMVFDCMLSDGQRMHAELQHPADVTLGRESGNSLVLPDPSVSGCHARITCAGAEVMLENISSIQNGQRNRLCVDRREIDGPTPLRNGAHLTVGTAAVTVTWPEPRPAAGDETLRAPRRPAGDATQRAPITLLEVSWTLEDGRQGKQAVKLAGTVTIGRDARDAVTIPDPAVSRSHLIVTLEQGALMLRNGSLDKGEGKNPFYCGGQAVYDQTPYREGQEIYAGGATIRLRLVR
ncbi:MAG: FHA domain-containing protein [Aristaeellaceae bacterium]